MQRGDDLAWLHCVREKELEAALPYFPKSMDAKVLEVGSGTGYMLGRIRQKYPAARGLEVAGSAYAFNDSGIVLYDGVRIPFGDREFDVVFSSHVLEHVADIRPFLDEIARVLKEDGVAIHIMPSPTWRLLTSLLHYLALIKMALSMVRKTGRAPIRDRSGGRSRSELLRFAIYAPRHGKTGNSLTELYYFSRTHWTNVFAASRLRLVRSAGTGLVYWGRDIFRFGFPVHARTALANVIGSSSNIYVLRKV